MLTFGFTRGTAFWQKALKANLQTNKSNHLYMTLDINK